MSKIIVESDYRRFKPVGQDDACADCPSGCKTSCARKLMENHEINSKKKEVKTKTKKVKSE